MIHELKIHPPYFNAKAAGLKNWEARKNDRDFKTGDLVLFLEWDPFITLPAGAYTGRQLGPYAIEGPIFSELSWIELGYVIFQHTQRPI